VIQNHVEQIEFHDGVKPGKMSSLRVRAAPGKRNRATRRVLFD
jgi:hypothetical protein